jgi:hypothetical protein
MVSSETSGIRTFLNLVEEDETNYAGEPFVPYQDLAATLCPEVVSRDHPIPFGRKRAGSSLGLPRGRSAS